ncbi:MAG TPA: 5'-nucleotidase C-terminal domain-containing protein [Gaiellaceae bacterium]|nr:5'-nucleotidase C-terminal domain-containing protein [Gaiellaceae bacterium]
MTKAVALLTGLLLAAAGSAAARPDAAAKKPTTNIQLVTVSDWHGQLTPTGGAGGAAYLKTYFDAAKAENPNTLFFMAGDSIGATPPISSFFEDVPAIRAMNMMGITADTFGNHNFDRGVDHLQEMVDLAEFDFVASNLRNLDENLSGVERVALYDVGGVTVGVVGIVNEEAPTLVSPGALGTLEITDSVKAANAGAIAARKAGADVVVVLTHKGVRGLNADGSAFGELIDLAENVAAGQIDVIVGDHTDFQYSGIHQDRVLVVENKSKGLTYAKIQLAVDPQAGRVVSRSASFHVPTTAGVTPDPEIQAYINELNAQLAPILGTVIGSSSRVVLRSDSCGRADGRLCESLVGNVVTDALRTTYGTDFAITNAGGLRAALTCPAAGSGGFCPTGATPPPYPITRGSVLGVLPFGNVSATAMVSGAEVAAYLEHGVSSMPGANGRFPQVSGLCFTYDVSAPVGSRVTSIVRQAADGTCTTEMVLPGNTYTLATNDFMAAGGDGYPAIISKATTRNIMDADVATYVASNSPLSPAIQGRIVCSGAACPAVTAP